MGAQLACAMQPRDLNEYRINEKDQLTINALKTQLQERTATNKEILELFNRLSTPDPETTLLALRLAAKYIWDDILRKSRAEPRDVFQRKYRPL